MARPWSARCYGVARPREGSRQNSIGGSGVLSLRHFGLVLFIPWRVGAEESAAAKVANYLWFRPARCCSTGSGRLDLDLMILGPRVYLICHPYAREGADGQAVVCPLLRGSSPTRGVAPKQHRGLGRAFTPAFRAGSLYPLARGCRRICRGESCEYLWFRPARCCSTGSGRLDLDLMILGPRVYLICHPYAREGADGQAVVCPLLRGSSPTRGVAPKQHRGLGRAFTPAFRAGSLYPLARGCRRICRGESWNMLWFRPARCCSTGSGRPDLDLMILGPRVYLICHPYAREGADGQAVVCPLLRGSSPTRGVAPKQHRGLGRAFTPAFRAGSLYPLARGCRRICRGEIWKLWFRPARCCSTGSGRPDLDLMISAAPRLPYLSPSTRARALMARPWSARCYGVARPREGSRQNSINKAIADQSPLLKLSLRRVRFQRTSTRQQLDCAKTL